MWAKEADNARKGLPLQRNWSQKEIEQLKNNGKVKGYYGHHVYSVKYAPEMAGKSNYIQFLTFEEHLRAHHGNFRLPSLGWFNLKTS